VFEDGVLRKAFVFKRKEKVEMENITKLGIHYKNSFLKIVEMANKGELNM
jgi:hypothetical protein